MRRCCAATEPFPDHPLHSRFNYQFKNRQLAGKHPSRRCPEFINRMPCLLQCHIFHTKPLKRHVGQDPHITDFPVFLGKINLSQTAHSTVIIRHVSISIPDFNDLSVIKGKQ
jgi:hypothetical protein